MVYGGQVQMGMAAPGYPMIPGYIGKMKHGKLKMKGGCFLVMLFLFINLKFLIQVSKRLNSSEGR
jgi:hypothetical protein